MSQILLLLSLKSFNDFLLLQEKFQVFTLVCKAPHDLAPCCLSDFILPLAPTLPPCQPLASLLILDSFQHIPASESLPWLFCFAWDALSPDAWLVPSFPSVLLRCHLIREAFSGHPLSKCTFIALFSFPALLFFGAHVGTSHFTDLFVHLFIHTHTHT